MPLHTALMEETGARWQRLFFKNGRPLPAAGSVFRKLAALWLAMARLPWRRFQSIVPFAVLVLAGCGGEVYEERLENTRKLFAHIQVLNEHLLGPWTDPATGVGLRVPLQFEMLPPPVKPEPAANENETPADKGAGQKPAAGDEAIEEIHDDRQPTYINFELPGLRGAFRATLKVMGENNTAATGEGWLYVMSNHDLYEKTDEAKEFNKTFVNKLAELLHVTVETSAWKEETHPLEALKKQVFVKPIRYTNVSISPDDDIGGMKREFSIYLCEQGEVQIIIMLVVPKDWETSEKLSERIPLCLETLVVPGSQLSRPNAAGGGAIAAPANGPGF